MLLLGQEGRLGVMTHFRLLFKYILLISFLCSASIVNAADTQRVIINPFTNKMQFITASLDMVNVSADTAGSPAQVIYNKAGGLGGDPGFTFDETANDLGISGDAYIGTNLYVSGDVNASGNAVFAYAPAAAGTVSLLVENEREGVGIDTANIILRAQNQTLYKAYQGATQRFNFGYSSDYGDFATLGYGVGNDLDITPAGDVIIDDAIFVEGTLNVSLDANITGNQILTGNAYISGDMNVTTNTILSGFFEVPNSTGDVALTTAGQIHFNVSEDQICVHMGADGEVQGEAVVSVIQHIAATFDPSTYYDQETTYRVLPLFHVGDDFYEGCTITEWRVNYVGGNPTTELDADLMFDTTPDYNPAANATVMDVIDTLAGVSSADTGFDNATAPNGSNVYIRFGADPVDANVVVTFDLWLYGEED